MARTKLSRLTHAFGLAPSDPTPTRRGVAAEQIAVFVRFRRGLGARAPLADGLHPSTGSTLRPPRREESAIEDSESDGGRGRLLGPSGHGVHPPVGRSRGRDVPRRRAPGGEDRGGAPGRAPAGHRDAEAQRLRRAPRPAQGPAHEANARRRARLKDPGGRPPLGPQAGRRRVSAQALHGRATPHGRPAVRPVTTSLLDTSAVVRACIFVLGGEPFALDVAHVREVMIFDEFTVVPLAPPHVIGLANLRGDVMPIVNARALLGLLPRRPDRAHRTLVVAADDLEIALAIDGVMSLEAFAEIVPVEEAVGRPYAQWTLGFLKRDDLLVPLLDAAKVLNALRPATARSSAV